MAERVALHPAVDLLLRPVRRRVGLRVPVVAVGLALEQRRPAPERARPTASRAASSTAHRSLPSTSADGIPYGVGARRDVGPR